MKHFASILSVSMILTTGTLSCNGNKENGSITRDDFAVVKTMSNPEKIMLDPGVEITDPISCYLMHDSLLLVGNQVTCNSFADLYSAGSGKLLAKLALKGRGPGEFLGFTPVVPSGSSNEFYATDGRNWYTIDALKTFADRKLHVSNSFMYAVSGNIHPFMNIVRTGDSSFVAYDIRYSAKPRLNPDNIPALQTYSTDRNRNTQEQNTGTPAFFNGPVNGAVVFRVPETGEIWMADNHTDAITIYNESLDVIKTVNGPDFLKPEYSVNEVNGISMVTFGDKQYGAYTEYTLANGRIYLIYNCVNGMNLNEYENNDFPASEIFVFDTDGNPLERYELDRYIYTLSVSSDGKTLVCSSRASAGEQSEFLIYR